jgi:multidrug efflux system outer membrane protein
MRQTLLFPLVSLWLGAGGGAGTLTVQQAVERALERYPSVSLAAANLEAARASVGEAQAGFWPALQANASATRHEEPYPVVPIHGLTPGKIPPFDQTLLNAQLQASYTLFSGGSRGARVRSARAQAGASEAVLEESRQGLTFAVVRTYLEVLSRRELEAAHARRIEALRIERGRAADLLEQGKAARVELLRVDASLAAAEAERVSSVTELATAEEDLARWLVAPPEETRAGRLQAVALRDTLLLVPADLLGEARQNNPASREARAGEAAAKAARGVARGARWPDLRLVGMHTSYGDGEGFEAGEWMAAVQAGLKLFTGGAIAKGIDRADAIHRAAADQVRLVESQVAAEIDRAVAGALEADSRVRSFAKAVASYEEVARIEGLSLRAGSGTQSDYLDAEASLLTARASLVEARHRQILTRLEIARLTGTLNPAWLRQNLETGS